MSRRFTRREILRLGSLGSAMALLAACQAKVVEKEVATIVKEVVKETVIVAGTPQVVEKEVTKVVEKEVTKIVEKEVEVVVTATPEPRAEIPQGGIVRMSSSSGRTKFFSPLWFIGSCGWDNTMPHVWLTLIFFGPGGDTYPYLAERFEWNETVDAVTFYLPKEARWSDGVDLTAEDVKWTYETLLTPGFLAFTGGEWGMFPAEQLEGGKEFKEGTADHISGIEIVDDKTVQFVLSQPNITFVRGLWRPIAPKHMYEGDETFEELEVNPFTQNSTVHSGPFRFVQFSEDPQFVEIESVHPYWVNTPNLHEANIDKFIMFQNLTGEQAVTKMEAGELEIRERPGADALNRVQGNPDMQLCTGAALSWGGFGVNGRQEYLQDKRVRQAFYHLIDRDLVNEVRFNRMGEPIVSPIFSPEWAVNPNLNQYEYDPEKAKQMLQDLAWDFSRELTYQSFATEEDPLALLAQQSFADIGITLKIKRAAFSGFFDIMTEGDYDLWFESGYDGAHPSTASVNLMCDAWNAKMTGYCNPELDELILESASTLDQDEAQKIAWRISEILNDEVPWLFATRDPLNVLVHKRLKNYVWSPVGDVGNTFRMADWYLED